MTEIADSAEFSVLQWNVWYRAQPEDIAEHLGAIIAEHGMPDVFCFQELTEEALEPVADAIEARDVSHIVTREHSNGLKEGQAMMAPRMIGGGRSPATDVYTLSRGGRAPFKGGSSSMRVLQVGEITAQDGQTVTVANAHTSYPTPTSYQRRKAELAGIVSALVDVERAVLVGDFNARPSSRLVRGLGSFMVRPHVDSHTWSSVHADRVGVVRRQIDHVFVSPDMAETTVQVLDNGPSDHHPLLVRTTLLH